MTEDSMGRELQRRIRELKTSEANNLETIKKLQEANRLLDGVLDAIPDIIGIHKPDQTVVRYNKAGYDTLQMTEQEVAGKPCFSLREKTLHCEDCATVRVIESKTTETVERFIPELGRTFVCRSNPIMDDAGNLSYIVEQLRDITEQKHLEREKDELILELRSVVSQLRSRSLYKLLAEKIREGVIIGHDEKIVYANAAARTMLKLDEQRLYGMNARDIFHDDHKAAFDKMLQQIKTHQDHDTLEMCCPDGSGETVWVHADCRPIEWKRQPGLLITLMDITRQRERRLADEKESVRLKKENRLLRSTHMHSYGLAHLVGTSDSMRAVYDKIISAAPIDENIIVYGESGTGKELVAKSIHDLSERRTGPFIAVNCGAIPENLAESEFFGHRKGSFSGADMDKLGFFESADTGTLFLDEIGEIPLHLQVKLLRVIEGYGFMSVGSSQLKQSDVRIIAATNRDMKALVQQGVVREDFYYRIHIIPIHLPPLRERKEDIPLLVYHFTRKMNVSGGRRHIPDKAIETFLGHDWPGNVRELQNTVSRYLAFETVEFAEAAEPEKTDDAVPALSEENGLNEVLAAYERRVIQKALSKTRGNKSLAAKKLGIDRRSLHRKISRLGI